MTCIRADGKTKIAFYKRGQAKRFARRVKALGGPVLQAYHCPDEDHYHVGHRVPRRLRLGDQRNGEGTGSDTH